MTELKTDFSIISFKQLFYHFIGFSAIFIFVFAKFCQGYWSINFSNKHFLGLNDDDFVFLKCHDDLSFISTVVDFLFILFVKI